MGGPYVLAPVSAPLQPARPPDRQLVLSIQDDLGYLLLAERLVGLNVLMYMHRGPETVNEQPRARPGMIPRAETFTYQGENYPRVHPRTRTRSPRVRC